MMEDIVNDLAAREISRMRPIEAAPFGVETAFDLTEALSAEAQAVLRSKLYEHRLLLFRNQRLKLAAQVRVMGYLGPVLPAEDELVELSPDGALGHTALTFHSDFAFTEAPIRVLSLHALDVNDGETATCFADGVRAAAALPADLRQQIEGKTALAFMALDQAQRAVPAVLPDFLPRFEREVFLRHPVTGSEVLYVTEMQTSHISQLAKAKSDALLEDLFARLYAPENVYEHRWQQGDLVIWDNLALQHGRPGFSGVTRRRMQRASVATHSFAQLCPQFSLEDPKMQTIKGGGNVEVV